MVTWNDDRGFGFLDPGPDSPQLFVHISAFPRTPERPHVGQRVSYRVAPGRDGRPVAVDVHPVDRHPVDSSGPPSAPSASAGRRDRPGQGGRRGGALAYSVVAAFAVLYLVALLLWQVPPWVSVLYVGMSLLAAALYVADKRAAVEGRWRVPEQSLILVGLIGGWPGAVVAQQVVRHKTRKAAFRVEFWASVGLNVIAFIVVVSPLYPDFVESVIVG